MKTDENEMSCGAIVLCNHWSQFGIGLTFPDGEVGGRWYRQNFSSVLSIESGRQWLAEDARNRICHEFDAYFLDSLAREDPAYLQTIRELVDSGVMELVGGTYGQAESQVFGYESAIRQLTFGQAAYRRHLGRPVTTYLVEEQSYFPQLPQLLRQTGFQYASIQFQNSGVPVHLPHDLILWQSPDGSTIPTVPPHPGLLSCTRQFKGFDDVMAALAGRPAPLVFQWIELWVPGLDWGATVAPYRDAIRALEQQGGRQMLLSEYIASALECQTPPTMRLKLDNSNYDNNFFMGGWGYENERTARGSNQCESLLMAAEALLVTNPSLGVSREELQDLWSRLLIAQNHDPYLAGVVPANVNGVRSFQSELAIREFGRIKERLKSVVRFDASTPKEKERTRVRLFNPCPWPVTTPMLLEVDRVDWPTQPFILRSENGETKSAHAVGRGDNGNILIGPVAVQLSAYGTREMTIEYDLPSPNGRGAGGDGSKQGEGEGDQSPPSSNPQSLIPNPSSNSHHLNPLPKGEGTLSTPNVLASDSQLHAWRVQTPQFEGVDFEPLTGQWRQVPSFFYDHPNKNVASAYANIQDAPATHVWRGKSDGMDVVAWRHDLMTIREASEPAMSVRGTVFAGNVGTAFVEFQHRLASNIRLATGPQPSDQKDDGTLDMTSGRAPGRPLANTWRFRVRLPREGLRIVADSPFMEEERRVETFYCSRYVRFEWPGRHMLWCPSQNTLFCKVERDGQLWIECVVLDFTFSGTTQWGVRFFAAESFAAAESMRLAETYHRRPMVLETDATTLGGIAFDNASIAITHVFPSPESSGVAVRAVNASDAPQDAEFQWPRSIEGVRLADLDGKTLPKQAVALTSTSTSWRYRFRPWEIATFCISVY